jgi:aldose 1-epimerase
MTAVDLSGDQIELEVAGQRATIVTVGATLRAYAVGDRAVVDGFAADQVCPDGRGQLLMPWPNRIADGRYEFQGRRHQVPVDEPGLGHAIHGLVRWRQWQVQKRARDEVQLSLRLPAQPGYPFVLDLRAGYRLSAGGLSVSLGVTNLSATACPFGAGAHPYFGFAGAWADSVALHVPAQEWLEVDARSIPCEHRQVAGSRLDFRRSHPIGAAHLDHAFTRLERDPEGVASVSLRHGEQEIRVWFDRFFDFVQVYTGDTLPDPQVRRRSVAVEPTTCAPNAFNTGDGLRVLAPGEAAQGRWGVFAG